MNIIRLLLAASALISLYLLVTTLAGGHAAGCGTAGGCDEVMKSRWGYWLGLPVSAPAVLLHVSLLVATFWATRGGRQVWAFLSFGAFLAVGAGAWFLSIQFFVLRRLCPYCLAAHLSAAAASILILRGARDHWKTRAVPGASFVGIALLIAGQFLNRPVGHEVRSATAPRLSSPESAGGSRRIEILDGKFKIDLGEVPLIGRADAPAVIISLFDYTCRHCRKMHGVLLEFERAHRGQVVIANLPMPLDAVCNPLIPKTPPQHANACQLARLGLAVWRADRSKMNAIDDWIFEPPTPPVMESALGYAQEQVGYEALGRAFNEGWVEKQLAQDIAIYETISKHFGNGALPQLIVGTKVVFGELENGISDLEALLPEMLK
jgi:uncharacterized membrane protein/protein-disulfide isomerase